jgi:hypothetical protein
VAWSSPLIRRALCKRRLTLRCSGPGCIKCSAAGGRAPRANERWRARVLRCRGRPLNLVVRRQILHTGKKRSGVLVTESPKRLAEFGARFPRRPIVLGLVGVSHVSPAGNRRPHLQEGSAILGKRSSIKCIGQGQRSSAVSASLTFAESGSLSSFLQAGSGRCFALRRCGGAGMIVAPLFGAVPLFKGMRI